MSEENMSAYLERLKQIEAEEMERPVESDPSLPINRPMKNTTNGLAIGGSPEEQEPDEEYKNSFFYQNFNNFMGNDEGFKGMFDEYTQLASGLKSQVDQGFMPLPIAEQKLRSYLEDSSNHYRAEASRNKDDPMNQENQQMMMQMIGALSNETPQGEEIQEGGMQ